MLARVFSAAVFGVVGYRVTVEAHVGDGMPRFLVVGLPDAAVRESKERVISAIHTAGVPVPFERVVVNLAPADIRKSGASFDLPMALAVAVAAGHRTPRDPLPAMIGELALDGALRPVRGILPMVLALRARGHTEVVVPRTNAAEASAVRGVRVLTAETLGEVLSDSLDAARVPPGQSGGGAAMPDLRDVKGQATARRAMEIAAAGGHHIGMVGPPGVGKTMLARRLPSVLPQLSEEEALSVSSVHSVAGLLRPGRPIVETRPFRAPHHTTSAAGLIGGYWPPRPGEASLAHHGVLFLDELPEVRRDALEALREPIEEGAVRLVRGGYRVQFPARFQLVVAMNPCPCGNLGHPQKVCRCTEDAVRRYRARVSGPLVDRIDLFLPLAPVRYEALARVDAEASAAVRARVEAARRRGFAERRGRNGGAPVPGPLANRDLDVRAIRAISPPDAGARRLLERAVEEMGFSARAHDRVLRVAKTIADLAGASRIEEGHVAEAMGFRGVE